MVTRCTGCDTILDSEHVSIPKVGLHDWGEWTTKVEPTETTEGISARVCKRCGLEETKVIEKKPVEKKSEETVENKSIINLVSTGDTAPVVLLVFLSIVATLAASIFFVLRRKR